MKLIGITGKSGSGKTTFASILSQKLKCMHIDVDKICHEALFQSEIIDVLCDQFGTGILDEKGNVDRKKVGNIAFAQKDKMAVLVDLTWGYMQEKIDDILEQNDEILILDGNLLPNCKYWDKCDYKILINSNDMERKRKILERDKISEEYFEKRDSASMDYSKFKFDYIFENDYQLQTINEMIEKINQQLSKNT